MNQEHNNVENFERKLESLRGAPLSNEERTRVWQQFAVRTAGLSPITSPYQRLFGYISVQKVYVVPLALALVVLLGAGGTVLAAGNSRPGDTLFPVELAVEHTRIALATNADAKAQLKLQFAQKRVTELEAIVNEEMDEDSGDNSDAAGASLDATSTTEIKLSEHGRARLEHALSVTEDFIEDSHRSASSTEHARGVLHDLDARFSATVDRLPLDLRNHGRKDDWKKDDDRGGQSDDTNDARPSVKGSVKGESRTDGHISVPPKINVSTGTHIDTEASTTAPAESRESDSDDSDSGDHKSGLLDFDIDTKGSANLFHQ